MQELQHSDMRMQSMKPPDLQRLIGTKMSPEYIRILERNYEATKGELKNLTGTIAKAAQVTFIDACDEALFKVQTGTCRQITGSEGSN